MATHMHEIRYKGSVTPASTSFLKAKPITMDFTGDIELDETDASNLDKIQKLFQKEMGNRLKNQLGYLDDWLKDKDKLIAEMVTDYENVQKAGLPATIEAAKARAKQLKELTNIARAIQKMEGEFREEVKNWAVNARDQGALICMTTVVKKARVKTFNDKSWRVRGGQALKVVLIVAGIALSIAAIVLTAGATAPVFIALASAGLALSGVSSLADAASSIQKNVNIEKKILRNVVQEVKKVQQAMKPLDGAKSSLAKHVTELKNLMKMHEDTIRTVEHDIRKKKAEIKGYVEALSALRKDASVDASVIGKKAKKVAKVKGSVDAAEVRIGQLKLDNTTGKALLDDLEALGVQLDKVSGQSSNSLAGNLKERFSSLDGWTQLGKDLGGVVSGASGAHA